MSADKTECHRTCGKGEVCLVHSVSLVLTVAGADGARWRAALSDFRCVPLSAAQALGLAAQNSARRQGSRIIRTMIDPIS